MHKLLAVFSLVILIVSPLVFAEPLPQPKPWRFDLEVLTLSMDIGGINHEADCPSHYAWVPAEYFSLDGIKRAKIRLLEACTEFAPAPFPGQGGDCGGDSGTSIGPC